MKNRLITMGVSFVMAAALLAGCGKSESVTEPQTQASIKDSEQETVQEQNPVSEGVAMAPLPDFSVALLGGDSADTSIFSEHKLTMVNVWGTFCGPCVAEMPMLQQMSEEMPEGTQLIGIVGDIYEGDTVAADQIVLNTGVTYPNLIAEGELFDYIMQNIIGFPTTFFVDENGNIVGNAVIGAREREDYEVILNERLKMLEN